MHSDKLSLIFLLSHLGRQGFEQVWQLHSTTHDLVCRLICETFADKLAIVDVEDEPNRIGRANCTLHEGLYSPQADQSERCGLLALIRRL